MPRRLHCDPTVGARIGHSAGTEIVAFVNGQIRDVFPVGDGVVALVEPASDTVGARTEDALRPLERKASAPRQLPGPRILKSRLESQHAVAGQIIDADAD